MVKTALYEGLIFDLDGTLWSTAEVCARAWNHAQALCALPVPKNIRAADVQAVTGLVQSEIFELLFPSLDELTRQRVAAACVEQEDEFLEREGGVLYPSVLEGLEELSRCYRMAIVSNCQTGYIERFLKKHGLSRLFCDFECHGNTGLSKRDNIVTVLNRQNFASAVYIGDTMTDERSAREAGLPFYWVEYGFGQRVPADRSFFSFDALVAHLSPVPP